MVENLEDYLLKKKLIIEESLNDYIEKINAPKQLKDSMHYSLMAGGKRLRPVLLMLSYEAYQTMNDKVISSAAALEMIHTYSLIHDDLPAMDDDDIRRGKPTNHKMFDEATAILAGDALLTYSFEVVANDSLLTLERVHEFKTGELIKYAILIGASLAKAPEKDLKHLERFAYYLGLIFQIQDDILDVTGDETKLGKPVGSDETNEKSTFPNLLGLTGAIKQKESYMKNAEIELAKTSANKNMLLELITYFGERDH